MIMKRLTFSLLTLGVVVLFLAPVWAMAHHAFAAEFDGNKPVQLKGTIIKMEWVNPHAWIYVAVKKPDGTVETWMVEGGTPNTLVRRGLRKTDVQAGIEIVVDGYRAKDGSTRANGKNITLPDGRQLFLGSEATGSALEGRDTTDTPQK
jgi:Family of unknown function (DUF6152)